jgi:hypothetical protein
MNQPMTREDYMGFSSFKYTKEERMEAHRKFYAQFVSDATIRFVVSIIGADVIKASTDEHMNDIPLRRWDCMHGNLPLAVSLKSLGESNSISTTVCIAKEAARIFAERE